MEIAPNAIAHVPSELAPLLLATNPNTIPTIPKMIGITNKERIEITIAVIPIPLPPTTPLSPSASEVTGRVPVEVIGGVAL